jgi:(R,R)-butanediol dehydrogenase/meso-butanediol dehydrogenase/diacetyl reductase
MKAAFVVGPCKIEVREVPDYNLDKDDVLVKVKYCGICGSDLHIYTSGAAVALGHEVTGDIAAVGEDVKEWKVGDRVLPTGRGGCGECCWCKQGKTGLCEVNFKGFMASTGSFATYKKVKHTCLYKLPDHMSHEEAAMVEPTSCALHAVRQAGMKEGDTVAVFGMGAIGQLTARVAKALGAGAVYAAEISPDRIALARGAVDEVIDAKTTDSVARIHELTDGMGADVVFECAGSVPTTQQSMAVVRKAGTIVIVGICFDWVTLPVSSIMLKELTLTGALNSTRDEFTESYELIRDKKIDIKSLATHKMPLDDINEAFEMAERSECGKILIEP